MRVLILADDCNPEWPSLPVVGYKAARAIADYVDVVVATHVRNRENIEKAGFGKATVHYVDNEYIAKPLYAAARFLRGGTDVAWTAGTALAYPSYLAFEWEVLKKFGKDLDDGAFDLIHRLTPMSPTLPSPLARWSTVPFILGPLNGGLKWPAIFRSELAREREWASYLRSAYRLMPYRRGSLRKSSVILAAFRHTMNDIGPAYARKIINFPEVGIDPNIFDLAAERPQKLRKTVLFVGRLVPYKLPQLVVRAFGEHPVLKEHRLIVAGDGPERAAIDRIIRENKWGDRIELCGWKSQLEIGQLMRTSDVFAQPSIRELGAGVVVEAMACGLPCVVVDYGGPGELIDSDRGIKVQPAPFEQLKSDFGNALANLVSDDEMMRRLGTAARLHAQDFYTWDAKAQKMVEVYNWALGQGHRPDFWAKTNL